MQLAALDYLAPGTVMKRFLLLFLTLIVLAFSIAGYTKDKQSAQTRAVMKVAKHQQKQQQKALAKYYKAQRKAEKKQLKQAKKDQREAQKRARTQSIR